VRFPEPEALNSGDRRHPLSRPRKRHPTRLRANDKDAGRTISYDRVVLRGGRFAHECLSLTGDLASWLILLK